jgi:succinoglycan biosynthesis transport protein ExoP
MVDGVLMAMKIRRKSRPNAVESVNILRAVGARVLGVVINNSDDASRNDGYVGYGAYRYGGYIRRYNRSNVKMDDGDEQPSDSSPFLISDRSVVSLRKEAVGWRSSDGNGQHDKTLES